MAANKFATMLHRNTNKMTLILVYAILEWTLIILLLLNSLFSYLIIKFSNYFGLKIPCVLCSRLDHIFEPGKKKNFHRDLICDAHASEISKMGFCLNHRKLVESQNMCQDCSSSMQPDCSEWSKKFAFFPWTKQIGKIIENGEESFKCSCCGVNFKHKLYPPCVWNKPSLEVLDFTQKGISIAGAVFDDKSERGDHSDKSRSEFANCHQEDEKVIEEKGGYKMVSDVDDDLGRREEEAEENGSDSFSDFCCREIEASEEEKVSLLMDKEQAKESIKEETLVVPEEDQIHSRNNVCPEIVPRDFEFYVEGDDFRLVPIELKCSFTTDIVTLHSFDEVGNSHIQDIILDFDMNVRPQVEEVRETWKCLGDNNLSVVESTDLCESESFMVVHTEEGDSLTWEFQQAVTPQATQTSSNSDDKVRCQAKGAMAKEDIDMDVQQDAESDDDIHMRIDDNEPKISIGTEIPDHVSKDNIYSQECDDDIHLRIDDNEPEISIGTEIPDDESKDNIYSQESDNGINLRIDDNEPEISIGTYIPDHESNDDIHSQDILPAYPSEQGDPSTGTSGLHIDPSNHDFEKAKEEFGEFKTFSVEINQKAVNDHLASEVNEVEDERMPDSSTSVDSLHLLHKKFLLLERKESGMEESLDGSLLSDIDASDEVLTNEKLISALRAERKALHALYAELEEERSASAVAANQTMAMINRIQEEKAAMQMEALQYQRMMEEQSEYDQEALQLLNELMVKREKEKQELEKELEIYRKKVQEYEAKEKLMLRKMKDCRTSSVSCSNAEDSDCLSIDLNNEAREEEDGFFSHEDISNQNTPADAVLEDSLSGFEEERLSILDQLRVLEEKLCMLSDEEEQFYKETRPIEWLHTENVNGHHEHLDLGSQANGVSNGHLKETNGKHHQVRRIMDAKAKILLPLFNAIETETEDVDLNGNKDGFHSDKVFPNFSIADLERDNKKLSIEEEVNHIYERLQALEEDREFLKHCISSLRKGDKGLILLQEILQHLRNLRSVELHTRNMGDGVM